MIRIKRPCVVFGYLGEGDVRLPGQLVERYREISVDGVLWSEVVMDPAASIASVKQARYEVAALIIAGLLTVSGNVVKAAGIPHDDETKHERLTILHMLDSTVDIEEVSRLMPVSAPNVQVSWSYTKAESLAKL